MNQPNPLPVSRSVLVTGAGKRLGKAIALRLADEGWAVAVHYHKSADAADEVVRKIVDGGGSAAAVQADLSAEAETASLVGRASDALGGDLGALVNNASIFDYDNAETATRDSWDRHMEANLRAPFVLAQAFAAQVPDNAGGSIVNLIDQRVWNLTQHFMTYTLSKAGLWTLTQTLAQGLAPRIRVNGIGPGPTLPSPRQSDEQFARQVEKTPLKRGATPEEIADGVSFLLAQPSITGQMIAMDGGQHLNWAAPQDGPEILE